MLRDEIEIKKQKKFKTNKKQSKELGLKLK
jgi:hypothetical protein